MAEDTGVAVSPLLSGAVRVATPCCLQWLSPGSALLSQSRACLQELAAQGKLPPGKVMSFAKPGEDQVATVFRDVYINDAPPEMRHHMTKRPTQDDVARRTGTQVSQDLPSHMQTWVLPDAQGTLRQHMAPWALRWCVSVYELPCWVGLHEQQSTCDLTNRPIRAYRAYFMYRCVDSR